MEWTSDGKDGHASTRKPYQELRVQPVPAGWRWTVFRIVPRNGAFRLVAHGVAKSSADAKAAAERAAK